MSEFFPQIARPLGEPAKHTAHEGYRSLHWPAQPDNLGKIEVFHNVITSPIGRPAQAYLALEAAHYTDTSIQSTAMHLYNHYMGVTYAVQQAQGGDRLVEVTYPHPTTMTERLAALPIKTTDFDIFNGTEFTLHALTGTIADQGRMIVADQGESMAHDVLTHALPTWALIPPSALAAIVDKADFAQQNGKHTNNAFARAVEGTMSAVALGLDIALAVRNTEMDTHNDSDWEAAACQIDMLACRPDKPYTPLPPGTLKHHVLAVMDAAAEKIYAG